MRLILFPGLGADERLFHRQLPAIPQAEVPAWLTPEPSEGLQDYVRRWAKDLKLSEGDPFVLGGMSFGGQVALEMARVVRPKAVLLISSHRNGHEISDWFRFQARMCQTLPHAFIKNSVVTLGPNYVSQREALDDESLELLEGMAQSFDPSLFQWSAKAAAEWQFNLASDHHPDVPVHHIHGENDSIIKTPETKEVEWIEGAGHLINYSHSHQLNKWISDKLEAVS